MAGTQVNEELGTAFNADPSAQILEKLKTSAEIEGRDERLKAVETVLSHLDDVFNDPAFDLPESNLSLELVPSLSPFMIQNDGQPSGRVVHLLEKLVDKGNPRELFMSLNERIGNLRTDLIPPDYELDGEDDRELNEDHVDQESKDRQTQIVMEYGVLLSLILRLLPRIRTKNPSNFLETLTSSIGRFLTCLEMVPGTRDRSSQAFMSTFETIKSIAGTPWASGDNALNALHEMLLQSSFVLLGSDRTSPHKDMSETYFFRIQPRLSVPHPGHRGAVSSTESVEIRKFWNALKDTATYLQVTPKYLLDWVGRDLTQSDPDPDQTGDSAFNEVGGGSTSAMSNLGAFLLLANLEFAADDVPWHESDDVPSTVQTLRLTLPMTTGLLRGGGGDLNAGVDTALFWLWFCIHGMLVGGQETLDEDLIYQLVPILSSLSATCQDPSIRQTSWRLVCEIVENGLQDRPNVQLEIIKDIFEDCPWPNVKREAVQLVKDLMDRAMEVDLNAASASIFGSPVVLNQLGAHLCNLPLPGLPSNEPSVSEIESFLDEHEPDIVTKSSFWYWLFKRDSNNSIATRNPNCSSTIVKSVVSLQEAFVGWERGPLAVADDADGGVALVRLRLSLVECALNRLKEVIPT